MGQKVHEYANHISLKKVSFIEYSYKDEPEVYQKIPLLTHIHEYLNHYNVLFRKVRTVLITLFYIL